MGEPIYENTTSWVSHDLLLEQLKGVNCTCRKHGVLDGIGRIKFAQAWPYEMCAGKVSGYQVLMWHIINKHSYPIRTYPYGIVFDCPVCRPEVVTEHPSHITTDELPKLCRYPDVTPWKWRCPGRKLRLLLNHIKHTNDDNCRHDDDYITRTRQADGQRRSAAPHGEPAIPAAGVFRIEPISDDLQCDLKPTPLVDLPGAASAQTKDEKDEVSRPDVAPPDNLDEHLGTEDTGAETTQDDGYLDFIGSLTIREKHAAHARNVLGFAPREKDLLIERAEATPQRQKIGEQ